MSDNFGDGHGTVWYCAVPGRMHDVSLEQLELVHRDVRDRCHCAHTKRCSAADVRRAAVRTHLRVLVVCDAVLSRRLRGDSMDALADLLKSLLRYDTSSHRNQSNLMCENVRSACSKGSGSLSGCRTYVTVHARMRPCKLFSLPPACPFECDSTAVCDAAGSSSRSKFVMDTAAFGGAQCGALTETTPCVALTCTDCAVSAWSGWSDCTVLCGSGLASRARSATTTSVGVAQACNAALTEAASCNTAACTPAPTLSPSLSPTQSPTTPRCDARFRARRVRRVRCARR